MRDMTEAPKDENGTAGLPRDLRFLKGLVTVLTVVMIGGVIAIVTLLVIRLNAGTAPVLVDPGMFAVPEGVGVVGIAVVDGRTVIVGDDGTIRVHDSESREIVGEFRIP
jgi:hypothetical protein